LKTLVKAECYQEREFSKFLIFQHSTGRFGADEETIKKADAIEIKIGQGAKGGFGGISSWGKSD
jgi:glutamate synthase domain-containing protein 2